MSSYDGFQRKSDASCSGPPAPPDPPLPPSPPPFLPHVNVFVSGEGGYPCHRIPSVVLVGDGELLAFSEARLWSGDGCYPHRSDPMLGADGKMLIGADGRGLVDDGESNRRTDIGMKRSIDGGVTWGNLSIVVPFAGSPTAVWDAERQRVMLQYSASGWIMALTSSDGGRTWSVPANVSNLLPSAFPTGVTVGPGVGLQLSLQHPHHPSRILFIGHHGPYTQDLVWFTDDGGATYELAQTDSTRLMDEAQLVELPDGRVMANMRNHHVNKSCKCRAVAISSDGGATFGELTYDPQLIEPICQATILRGGANSTARDALFFANPATTSGRTNGHVRRSDDAGRAWLNVTVFVGDPYAYSCLAHTPDVETLGLLWETWEPVGGEHCNGEACSIVWSTFAVALS